MIEDVLTAMQTALTTNLDAELTKQDSKYADGITLSSVAQVLLGDETVTEAGLPAVIISSTGQEFRQFLTSKKDVVHQVNVSVIVDATTEANGQQKLWRTIRAIENVFEIHLPGSSGILEYRTDQIDFTSSVFEIDESRNTSKAGVMSISITERVDAYTSSQI